LSTTVRDLAPGSTHTFSVRGRVTSGNLGAASTTVTVTLPGSDDSTAPAAPGSLTAADATETAAGNRSAPSNPATVTSTADVDLC
jgi:hypothetical protein